MIYLDHHAATPLLPEAREAMAHADEVAWANPASPHRAGQRARAILERAREEVAGAVGGAPADVVFTSGGTEAVNLAVLGLVRGLSEEEGGERITRVVRTRIAHPALLESVAALGVEEHLLEVPGGVPVSDEQLAEVLGPGTLVAVSWVNHETGTILPVARWAELCRERGARFVVDGCQALGKVPVDGAVLGADALCLASPKIGGPAGAGAVLLRRGSPLSPFLRGGGQERGRRPGSPNVSAAAGFGAAATVPVLARRLAAMAAIGRRRDRLEHALLRRPGVVVNGVEGPRVPTVTNVSIAGTRGDRLVAALDLEGLATAAGAACSSGVATASKVVAGMYLEAPPERARSTLRLSLGPETSDADVTLAIEVLERVLARFE